jgi:type IV pilus assembly protein PilB
METKDLLQLLVNQSYISEESEGEAEAYEKAGRGSALEYLLQENILDRPTLGSALAESLNTTFTDLDARNPSSEDLIKLPEDIARAFHAVYVGESVKEVQIATDRTDVDGLEKTLSQVPAFAGKKVRISYAFPESVDVVLAHYQKELNTRFAEIVKNNKRVAPELFDEIIKDALSYHASDVHFEPTEKDALIRFRIDGMLRQAGSISRENYENVLNRMKIQSNLRTDEHFAPQDGAIRFTATGAPIDLRLSIVPTLQGEKAVIRILAEYVQGLTFEALGFSGFHREQFERASKKPFGMILTVGPTGSGKTTTLYTLIRHLNVPESNITTIEDPVEYRMEGANQIQVNQKTDLTFAKGLRAVMRQDPNVILVGEIRDRETAETAVNAALTGHLLLSTFHANDAATTIPRLLDMGIEAYLLSSTLELIVAQRLVRRICTVCRVSYVVSKAELVKRFPEASGFFKEASITLYKGNGCPSCNNLGYKGRMSIVETIEVSMKLKALIGTRPSAEAVRALAKEEGNHSLFDDGLDKARQGSTTIEEVIRVASPV